MQTLRSALVLASLLAVPFFGLAAGGCNTTTDAQLETYSDGAVEDYGCILGDLDCECSAGNSCDQGLVCTNGVCVCESGDCEPMGPQTSGGDEADMGEMGSETMSTEGTDTGMETTDATDATDTTTETETDTTESTDTTDTETSSDTGTDTDTESSGDTGTDTGGSDSTG